MKAKNESSNIGNNNTGSDGVSMIRLIISIAAALVLNLLALFIGPLVGASLKVNAPENINVLSITVATVLPLLIAGIIVWFLAKRYSIRIKVAWIGLIFALVSSVGSFLAAADTATALTLTSMHFFTGFAWFAALRPWLKSN